MSRRVTLPISMKLLSDTIFGSGFSIPGGEDIAVCRDQDGFPYLKGSTLKGLLRESFENLSAWRQTDAGEAAVLFGEPGWSGTADSRRLMLTGMTLTDPPRDAADCYTSRAFTALEDGVVKTDTLRTAACVRGGLCFAGIIECSEEDTALVRDILAGVKWLGTLRSRGFGRVCLTAGQPEPVQAASQFAQGRCIRYRLRSEQPLILTDPGRSSGNTGETLGWIPGSAVRGAVLSRLAAQAPELFAREKQALLGDGTRFLDALPSRRGLAALPAIKGFYEDKQGTRLDRNIVTGAAVAEGHKRAKLGTCCAPDPEKGVLRYWSAETGGALRIGCEKEEKQDKQMFSVRYLEAGQEFEGCILLENTALAPHIAGVFGDTLWLGADRYAGFGKCSVEISVSDERPAWEGAYGYAAGAPVGDTLYLLAVSPFTMLNAWGEPCGIDEEGLARRLGVNSVRLIHCSTSVVQSGGYNRIWQCRAPTLRMYDRGSVFCLKCSGPPQPDALLRLQAQGLGVRRAEGCGQILFLRPELLEGVVRKQSVPQEKPEKKAAEAAAHARRAGCRWLNENANAVRKFGVSASQLGTLQVLCKHGDSKEVYAWLDKNRSDRGAEHGDRFRQADAFIRAVLERPLSETLGTPAAQCEDTPAARLHLLDALFGHSRKGKGEQ